MRPQMRSNIKLSRLHFFSQQFSNYELAFDELLTSLSVKMDVENSATHNLLGCEIEISIVSVVVALES